MFQVLHKPATTEEEANRRKKKMNGKERGSPEEMMQDADRPDDCGVDIINRTRFFTSISNFASTAM